MATKKKTHKQKHQDGPEQKALKLKKKAQMEKRIKELKPLLEEAIAEKDPAAHDMQIEMDLLILKTSK